MISLEIRSHNYSLNCLTLACSRLSDSGDEAKTNGRAKGPLSQTPFGRPFFSLRPHYPRAWTRRFLDVAVMLASKETFSNDIGDAKDSVDYKKMIDILLQNLDLFAYCVYRFKLSSAEYIETTFNFK